MSILISINYSKRAKVNCSRKRKRISCGSINCEVLQIKLKKKKCLLNELHPAASLLKLKLTIDLPGYSHYKMGVTFSCYYFIAMRSLDVRVFLQLQSQTCFICSFTEELSTHTFYSVLLFFFKFYGYDCPPRLVKVIL